MSVADYRTYQGQDDIARSLISDNGFRQFEKTKLSPMAKALTAVEGWSKQLYTPGSAAQDGGRTSKMKLGDGTVVPWKKSGISAANGVDLGQHSPDDFAKMDIEPYLIDRFEQAGAFGAQDMAAEYVLGNMKNSSQGNFLTEGENNHLGNKVIEFTENKLRAAIDKIKPGRYDNMTFSEQYVMMSLAHLYGNELWNQKKADGTVGHKGFHQAIEGDWVGLYDNMKNYGHDQHDSRHRKVRESLQASKANQRREELLASVKARDEV